MNGIIAAAFWTSAFLNPVSPLFDGIRDRQATADSSVQMSAVYFQREIIGEELGVSVTSDTAYGPLQPIFAGSVTETGSLWVGYGFLNEIPFLEGLSFKLTFIPGVYSKGNGEDLGGWLMFRSGVNLVYNLSEKYSLGLGYDHRSSGDIWAYNPGMETVNLQLSIRNKQW